MEEKNFAYVRWILNTGVIQNKKWSFGNIFPLIIKSGYCLIRVTFNPGLTVYISDERHGCNASGICLIEIYLVCTWS